MAENKIVRVVEGYLIEGTIVNTSRGIEGFADFVSAYVRNDKPDELLINVSVYTGCAVVKCDYAVIYKGCFFGNPTPNP